jgi:opacity protein-like surface antigen
MHLKPYLGLVLALFFFCAADRALAQAAPAATEARSPLAIGVGVSGYNPDYGHGHLLGYTLWFDYSPSRVPQVLRGIGLEAFGRDLNYGRSKSQPPNLRQDVGGGGVFYSWPAFRNLRPYAKIEMGFGNQDYAVALGTPQQHRINQTRTVTSLGGGVELRAFRNVWVRADYEYQSWPDFYYKNRKAVGKLDPQGFTVGAIYHFSRPHFR